VRNRAYTLCLIILTGLLTANEAVEAEQRQTIRWLVWEQVPNFISKGPFKEQGIGDSFTKALQDKLPQFDHINVVSNTRRYQSLIRQKDTCVAWAWIVPGSEEFRLHSRPVSLAPRTAILTLKSKQDLFGKPGEVLSLENLLTNPAITLGYLEDMTYSKRVHELLEQYRGKDNLYFSSASAVEISLDMLASNRLDYIFGFPGQATFDAETKGIESKYQFYQIEEINKFTSMHSHCHDGPLGQTFMAEINKILTDDILLAHLAVVERWNGIDALYKDAFMNYVINQQPSSFVTNPGE